MALLSVCTLAVPHVSRPRTSNPSAAGNNVARFPLVSAPI